jgi:Protein phosphatase 2C
MWNVIGGSVIGNAHIAAHVTCQDASGWHASGHDVRLVVADGAGSRSLSDQGAKLAVEHVLNWRHPEAQPGIADLDAALRHMIGDTHNTIRDLALSQGHKIGDYATTLAVGILTEDSIGIVQVGDTITIVGTSGRYEAITPAVATEYVNETNFITDDDALQSARISVFPARDIDTVVLSTDGLRFKILQDLSSGAPFVPFFEDLVKHALGPRATDESICQFLSSVNDQSGDDKSLLVAVRIP